MSGCIQYETCSRYCNSIGHFDLYISFMYSCGITLHVAGDEIADLLHRTIDGPDKGYSNSILSKSEVENCRT